MLNKGVPQLDSQAAAGAVQPLALKTCSYSLIHQVCLAIIVSAEAPVQHMYGVDGGADC